MKNFKMTKKTHNYLDAFIGITEDMTEAFSKDNVVDLFSVLMSSAKKFNKDIKVDPNYEAPDMGEDTDQLLAFSIVTDQCLILTQQSNQLLIMALQLKNSHILDPTKNTLSHNMIPRKTLKRVLRKKNKQLIRTQKRRIAVHPRNYERGEIGFGRTLDKDENFYGSLYVPTISMNAKLDEGLSKRDIDFQFHENLHDNSNQLEENTDAIEDNSKRIENFTEDTETWGLSQVSMLYIDICR